MYSVRHGAFCVSFNQEVEVFNICFGIDGCSVVKAFLENGEIEVIVK